MRHSTTVKTSITQKLKQAVACSAIAALALGAAPAYAAGNSWFTDIPANHWAYKTIQWAQENQIVQGYQDGTFRPNANVSEPEFLAMLLRAYPEIQLSASSPWYAPYYEAAAELDWPVAGAATKAAYTRGQVAQVLAAAMGQQLSVYDSIQYLLDHQLATGKTEHSVAGFKASDPLSRAEAQTFIYRLKQFSPKLVHSEEPAKTTAGWSLNGIRLGDSEAQVTALLGRPDRTAVSEYSFRWYIYTGDYTRYAQIGIENGKVVALYSNAAGWTSDSGVTVGSAKSSVTSLGKAAAFEEKDKWTQFTNSQYNTTVFFDNLNSGKVDAILLLGSDVKTTASAYEGTASQALLSEFEQEVLDVTNAFRVRNGVKPLVWNDDLANTARKHSTDMGTRNYFSHSSPEGNTVSDRMKKAGLMSSLRSYGENIAAGYDNAFEVVSGWVNSEGHRENLLMSSYSALGVGAIYNSNGEYRVYYTQNFGGFR